MSSTSWRKLHSECHCCLCYKPDVMRTLLVLCDKHSAGYPVPLLCFERGNQCIKCCQAAAHGLEQGRNNTAVTSPHQHCFKPCAFQTLLIHLFPSSATWQASQVVKHWSKSNSNMTTSFGLSYRSDRAGSLDSLGPLLTALEVPVLSRTVQQSVPQVQGFSGSSELDPVIADCVLAVQRYLLHRQPEVYHALDSRVVSQLLNLRYVDWLLHRVATSVCCRRKHSCSAASAA